MAPSAAATAAAPSRRYEIRGMVASGCERRIGPSKGVAFDRDLAHAEHAAQLLRRYLERTWSRPLAGRRLWERRRQGGLERDVAFDFLHDLMDVAVEHGDRTEALEIGERLVAVVGSPAPLRIKRPHRHVRHDDDGRAGAAAFQVALDPLDLLVAEMTQAAGLQADDVDQRDEMNAALVETVPATGFDAGIEAGEERLAVIDQ